MLTTAHSAATVVPKGTPLQQLLILCERMCSEPKKLITSMARLEGQPQPEPCRKHLSYKILLCSSYEDLMHARNLPSTIVHHNAAHSSRSCTITGLSSQQSFLRRNVSNKVLPGQHAFLRHANLHSSCLSTAGGSWTVPRISWHCCKNGSTAHGTWLSSRQNEV